MTEVNFYATLFGKPDEINNESHFLVFREEGIDFNIRRKLILI